MQIFSPRPDALVFDFDGTIADTRQLIITSYREAFAKVALDCPDDETIGATIGIPLASAFRVLTGQDGELIDRAVRAYQDIYRRHGYGMVQAFPGMIGLVRGCAAAGYRMAIGSSRSGESLRGMADHLGIAGCFELILSRDDVSHEKPHPEMLQLAAGRLGVEPDSLLMIGDTSFDIEMGSAAGARTVAVSWGNHTREQLEAVAPTCVVDSVDQLQAVLGVGEAVPAG
ncbi:HAD family hydrolase [Spirochaeta africana]|uniref:Haloacid dehalogenase superfamily enzyme, subfamily IA n=1 Tax=Spirochaeta africana (strain ATCC 700263 / DSM 8902 / Z-7692) TaxID=889378 RepID=H9ULA5_SPIAZ|nr:HAD family hydrolase [Spirochaeta africana]AFG38298.1 haloacid dehalogenase superfamily enzyme, subfamily IA [Spirochaeta africana DSM 8902]